MTNLIDDYLREVEASLRVDASRKRQIVDELRTHLTEKVDDLQREAPDRARHDVEQEVVREFGNARDLALAYEPDGTAVLMSGAGDIVLRLGKAVGRGAAAVGRGTGTFLKWTAVALGILLVLSIGVGAWAYYEVKPYIPDLIESSEPAYSYYQGCVEGTPCNGAPPADSFYVRPDAHTVRFDLNVWGPDSYRGCDGCNEEAPAGNGTLHVVVADQLGATLYDRTFDLANQSSLHHETSWAATEGNWTIAYTFDNFVGTIDVESYVISVPWDRER